MASKSIRTLRPSLKQKISWMVRKARPQAELAQARRRLQALMDAAPVGISFSDDTSCVRISGNPAARAQFQVTRGDNLSASALNPDDPGRRIRYLHGGREVSADELPLQRAVAEERVVGPMLLEVRMPGGRVWYADCTGAPVKDEAGRVIGGVAVTVDKTATQRAEVALRESLESAERAALMRQQLLSIVSHDLRNPLSAIVMQLASLRKQIGQPREALDVERLAVGLTRMERQAARMERLIAELLDVAQLQAGQPLQLRRRHVELVGLTQRLIEEHQRGTTRHQLELRAEVPELLGQWDADRLERVLDNLLSNAVKYSPDGGPVQVCVRQLMVEGFAWGEVEVRDRGVGIAAGDLDRVFDWFVRGENVQSLAIRGTGIGLSGARQIVEQHGGAIVVSSAAGQGATFTVRLPVWPFGGPMAARRL